MVTVLCHAMSRPAALVADRVRIERMNDDGFLVRRPLFIHPLSSRPIGDHADDLVGMKDAGARIRCLVDIYAPCSDIPLVTIHTCS